MEVKDGKISTRVECKKCKNVIELCRENVTFEKYYKDENGQSILITYFDCPSCKERHYVQIDNYITRDIKKDVQRMFVKFHYMKHKNILIPEQQQCKFNKIRNNLSKRRFRLMKRYEGKVVTDTETGEKITLNFTIV